MRIQSGNSNKTLQPLESFENSETKQLSWFHLWVTTGDNSKAGIGHNGKVSIKLDGCQQPVILSHSLCNELPFQRRQVDEFRFSLPLNNISKSIGQTISIKMSKSNDWFLDTLVLVDIEKGWEYNFSANRWIKVADREVTLHCNHQQTNKKFTLYEIEVTTGNLVSSGTSAQVYVQLTGTDKVTTKEVKLVRHGSACFSRGQTDSFQFYDIDVGDIQRLRVWHNNAGLFPGWFLNNIRVTSKKPSRKAYEAVDDDDVFENGCYFFANKWFAVKEGDRQISRVLFARNRLGSVMSQVKSVEYKIKFNYTNPIVARVCTVDMQVVASDGSESGAFSLTLIPKGANSCTTGDSEKSVFETTLTVHLPYLGKNLRCAEISCYPQPGVRSPWILNFADIVENRKNSEPWFFWCGLNFGSSSPNVSSPAKLPAYLPALPYACKIRCI